MFVAVVIPPPQLNVAPGVVDDAAMLWLVNAQVNTAGVAILTLGDTMFWVTLAEAVFVQPFVGSVTVTTYPPTVDIVLLAVVIPPPQLNVVPVVVDEAVNVTVNVEHVKIAGGAIAALGAIIFCVTVDDAALVQPFVGSVTVTE